MKQKITTIFHDPTKLEETMRSPTAEGFYAVLESLRHAANDPSVGWAGYKTFQDYANICFWAIRKLEYGFIVDRFARLESFNSAPLRVLDMGCGVVPLNNWISARGHEVIALDPLFDDIEFLVKNDLNSFYSSNVFYLTSLGEALPFPTGYFDVVVSASVLEHTIPGNDYVILNEIARVLKPGGELLITFDVSPPRSLLEGERALASSSRYFGYPFQPDGVRRLFHWLSRFYKVTSQDISPELDDITWDRVHAFWRTTQEHDRRQANAVRDYLALGASLCRNDSSASLDPEEILRAYREGQSALEQQLELYRYHADGRLDAIEKLGREITDKEKLIQKQRKNVLKREAELREKDAELIAKENIIQSFLGSPRYWLLNGPFRHLPLFRRLLTMSFNVRDRFAPKLGVYHQYPPRPLNLPQWYQKQPPRLADADLPVISIVTPSYNQAVFLECTIQSVLTQEYPKLEYVIQDGNSTDGSADLLEKYRAQLKHGESVPDSGQGNAINRGIRHTSGEIMAYLNSDDMLLPGTLHYVARYFIRHPDVDVIYGHRVIVDENNQEVGVWVLPPHDKKALEWADYIPQETMFWRRRIWEKSGGEMDESFQFALDWDLLIRFQQAGAKIVRLPRFLAAFRVHNAQKSTAQINEHGVKEMKLLRQRIHGREVSWMEINKHTRSYLTRSVVYHQLYRMGVLR
jgi:SAM-dependent methyltransferase/GT2 family glycosyltransferase